MISSQNREPAPPAYPVGLYYSSAMPYNGQNPTMGKVVRVRPNIYIFVCDVCHTEHFSIDSFLRHSEAHFQYGQINNLVQGPHTQVNSNWMPPGEFYPVPIANGYTTFVSHPSQVPQVSPGPVDATASPTPESEEYIEEVYEITDLGYDYDGNYAIPENVVDIEVANGDTTKPKSQSKKKFPCTFCYRKYSKKSSLATHKSKIHPNIMAKLHIMKKSYKCLVCKTKLLRKSYSQVDAEKHIKIHFKKRANK